MCSLKCLWNLLSSSEMLLVYTRWFLKNWLLIRCFVLLYELHYSKTKVERKETRENYRANFEAHRLENSMSN